MITAAESNCAVAEEGAADQPLWGSSGGRVS